ncbi:hypothetical protein Ae201684P_002061 [Aphanomyces euteiches]|nr:hypothetical protein Ae201684P_002061 [Aphanomyces euteiches]
MHAMHAAQAAMAVLASEDMRATAMGRLSLSYGVGMPLFSPFLSFPSTGSRCVATRHRPSRIKRLKKLHHPLTCTRSVRFQRSCAKSSALDIGLVMSVGGVVSIVANGVLLQFFLSRWSERSVIFGSSVVIALSFVLYAHLPIGEGALAVLMALTVPLMGASAIANTVLSSQMSKGAKNEDRATAIGLSHASRSACGLVAPTLGAIVLQDYGFQALGYTCAIATVISIACSTKPRPSA